MGKPPIKSNQMPPIAEPIEEVAEVQVKLKIGMIEIPMGPLPGYVKRRVDVGRMSREQSERLGEITSGLQFKQAKLKNGSPVKSELHAIRWVLENLK